MDINETLDQRQKTHGIFTDHAKISQKLKAIISVQYNYGGLKDDQKEALEMIMHKVARPSRKQQEIMLASIARFKNAPSRDQILAFMKRDGNDEQ